MNYNYKLFSDFKSFLTDPCFCWHWLLYVCLWSSWSFLGEEQNKGQFSFSATGNHKRIHHRQNYLILSSCFQWHIGHQKALEETSPANLVLVVLVLQLISHLNLTRKDLNSRQSLTSWQWRSLRNLCSALEVLYMSMGTKQASSWLISWRLEWLLTRSPRHVKAQALVCLIPMRSIMLVRHSVHNCPHQSPNVRFFFLH